MGVIEQLEEVRRTYECRRFALQLYAGALNGRPRRWKLASEEVACRAEDHPDTRPIFLYYAAAIARDRGEHDVADALLARGADPPPLQAGWWHEFELQLALSEALLHANAAAARARLHRLPPHPSEPGYPRLAEAAVLLAESRPEEAAEAMRRWYAAAAASGAGLRRLEVGNLWAIEILREGLGERAPKPPRARAAVERHRPLARVAYAVLGAVFAVSFSAITAVTAVATWDSLRGCSSLPAAVGALVTLLTASIAVYGVALVVRGVRGRSRVWLGRGSILLQQRVPTAPSLWWLPLAALIIGWASAGSLREFLLVPSGAQLPWFVVAFFAVLWPKMVFHEFAHAGVARALGGTVHEIMLGHLRIHRDLRGWHLRRRAPWSRFWGHAVMEFTGSWVRTRKTLALAAGPAWEAVFMVAMIATVCHVSNPVGLRLAWVGTVVGSVGLIANLAPSPRSYAPNDGRQIWEAIRCARFWSGPVGRRLSLHLRVHDRPRSWQLSAEEIERAARRAHDRSGLGLFLSAARALDGDDPRSASRLLAELVSQPRASTQVRMDATCQLALSASLLDLDPARARTYLDQAVGLGAGRYAKLGECAALAAEGRLEHARAAWREWSAWLPKNAEPEAVRALNQWAIDALTARGT